MPFRSGLPVRVAPCLGASLCVLLGCFAVMPAFAESLPAVGAHEPAWELYGESDDEGSGYVMYTRKPPGSEFSAYRLEAVLDSPAHIVAEAAAKHMVDPNNTQKNTDKTVLRNDDEMILIYSHIRINAPFVSDRDVVTRVERIYDPESRTHQLRWRATDEGPPPKDGVIRLDRSDGSWTFSPLGERATRAVYTSHTEIAGALPAWLLNSFMSDTMVRGIEGLRTAVAREHARHTALTSAP